MKISKYTLSSIVAILVLSCNSVKDKHMFRVPNSQETKNSQVEYHGAILHKAVMDDDVDLNIIEHMIKLGT